MIRILIVDDQKYSREAVRQILEQDSEIEIIGLATDGQEAVNLAAVLNPDIVLMDLEMPYLNGIAATKLISKQNPKSNVIILTIEDKDELLFESLNAGARGYLLKNIEPEEIINTIHVIHEGNPFIQKKAIKAIQQPSIWDDLPHKYPNNPIEVVNKNVSSPSSLKIGKEYEEINYSSSRFDFSDLFLILKRRFTTALMGFSSVLLGAILYLIFAQRNYQATALISLEDRQKSISELGRNLSNIEGSIEYSPLSIQAKLIKSEPVLSSALKNIVQKKGEGIIKQDKNISLDAIEENLGIKILPNTNILEISYVNPDPKFASTLLNEIIDTVIARNTDIIRSEASSVKQFLEQEVSNQRSELSVIEAAENRYRKQQGFVDIDNQTANLVNLSNKLASQEQDLLAQIREQEAKVNNLKQIAKVNDAESAYIEGTVGQAPQVERLRTQLTEVDAELAAARANLTDKNPIVIALQEKRDEIFNLYQKQIDDVLGDKATISLSPSGVKLKGLTQTENGLGQEVTNQLIINQTELEANRNKLQAIQIEKEKLENQIALLPAKVQSLTELVRQRTQATKSLQFLQRQLEEARIAEAQLVSNIQIIELANIPSSPSSPQTRVVLASAFFVGIILGVGIILLLEKTDKTFYDDTGLESQLKIPFLTALPHLSDTTINLKEINSFLDRRDLYEPYRSLLKKLEFRLGNSSKVIVVTSAIAQEGKSVVASHLAAVSAMLSRKTLIIDAHLCQPEQYRLFDVQLQPGLKDIVTNSLELTQVIQPTEIKNLSVLTSGISTPNSCRILESPNIPNILKEATNQYDLIIIDAPPVSSSCDAYTLSHYSDGLVMVTRPFISNKDSLEQTVEDLKRNKAPIIGFVVNHAKNQPSDLYKNLQTVKKSSDFLLGVSKTNNSYRDTEEVSKP